MVVPLWGWLTTILAIGSLVAVDIRHTRQPHAVMFREALKWSVVYVGAAVIFGGVLAVVGGSEPATAYFAGYLVEKSLSVDNLFVFAVILAQFAVPARHQQRALLIGVVGALAMRAAFIAAGAAVVHRFAVTFVAFGAFLVYTAVHMLRTDSRSPTVADNRAVGLLRRFMPVTSDYSQGQLIARIGGRRAATPLLVVVIAILSVDILFALDSIPAVFGITDNAYLVFTANAFALLGLRALYFLLIGLLDRLVHLRYGLAVVLAFIGVKLVLHYVHTVNSAVPEITTGLSLVVVLLVLGVTTLTSLRVSRISARSGITPRFEPPASYPHDSARTIKTGGSQ